MRNLRGIVVGTVLVLSLGACANDGLRVLTSDSQGPDEFLVHPVKPLQQPENLAALPTPTPGGANLTDHRPLDDVAIALGGKARPSASGPIPGSDGAIVSYASRFGVSADIRQSLAQEDAEFRKGRARFTQYKIVSVDNYDKVYEGYALDPFAVAESFRRIGVKTPSSPPSVN